MLDIKIGDCVYIKNQGGEIGGKVIHIDNEEMFPYIIRTTDGREEEAYEGGIIKLDKIIATTERRLNKLRIMLKEVEKIK